LAIKGEVVPSTLEHVSLLSKLKNGQMALGEVDMAVRGHRFGIDQVIVEPRDAAANPRALCVIAKADVIIFGPGSLYTSIVPNLLIEDINKALEASTAKKIYVCNVSTERGETEGFGVEEHMLVLKKYLGQTALDFVLVNNNVVSKTGKEGKFGTVRNITTDKEEINDTKIILADLIDESQPLFHDSEKLAQAVWELIGANSYLPVWTTPVVGS
jgi:uncharacterized cofD-like protein